MAADRTISSAIEACYDAAFEFRRWPQALQTLADSLGVTSCVIRTRDQTHPFRSDQRRRTLTPDSTEHTAFAALWVERIEGAPDPHVERLRLLLKPPNSFVVEDEVSTPEERNVLPFYQEIARPGDREWWASATFMVKDRKWCLSMFRDARRGRFDPCEADYFMRVTPELKRIISIAEKVWEISISPSLAVLDQLNCAAALLDCRGCAYRFNKHAESLLGSGLIVRHGRVYAADPASDTRLQELIRAGILNAPPAGGPAPAVIARNGQPWLLAEIVPMTSFAHDLFNGGDMLLYFTGLSTADIPDERLLSRTFGLTEAEARLAASLADGDGIKAASARLAISRETARTQLRAVFAKTGTQRQAELAVLLSRLRKTSRS